MFLSPFTIEKPYLSKNTVRVAYRAQIISTGGAVGRLSELILAKDPMDKVLFLKSDLFFDFLVGNLGFPRRDDEFIFDIVISF